ncbi:MAG: hypothetical protein P1S59_14490, partial [bacterium]|nr:hypothetical protein [bacterium]
ELVQFRERSDALSPIEKSPSFDVTCCIFTIASGVDSVSKTWRKRSKRKVVRLRKSKAVSRPFVSPFAKLRTGGETGKKSETWNSEPGTRGAIAPSTRN